MLTLEHIRDHLRIDGDYEDAVLNLYVKAALGHAERVTGMRFSASEVTDVADVPTPGASMFELANDPTGPVVAVVTSQYGSQRYPVQVDGRMAILPIVLSACDTSKVTFKYHVGPSDPCSGGIVDTDPTIEAGILKYVAYAWMHRGDAVNNWQSDSGALQDWQTLTPVHF